MKFLLRQLGLVFILLASSGVYAVNPVPGWYGGLMLGVSQTPNIIFPVIDYPSILPYPDAKLAYRIFGDFGLYGGYRYCHFRGELQFLINNNHYNYLEYGPFIVYTPTSSTTLRMKGQTTTAAFMLNGFYDIYTPDTETSFVPYVGIGFGYAEVKNNVKFYYNNIVVPNSILSRSSSATAAQGIVGLSYFLDDFASFGLDYRYFTTDKVQPFNQRLIINSINLSFTGGFDAS